ncbi:DUF1656 domain-containing protein [Entomobacter blattae]|nr:DUF1656 domain-containing protein [Entomobacter blattae]
MLSEFNIFGVFIAPVAVYAVAALFVFLIVRNLIRLLGLAGWFWHFSLFEVSLYACIVCLLVKYL